MNIIRLATRQSPLALWQANYVKTLLQNAHPELAVELVPLLTQGDKDQSKSLIQLGGKTSFVKELQLALLENQADFAVHSVKDMSVFNNEDLCLAAITKRANPSDVLVSPHYNSIAELPLHAKVGTSSPRRASQLKKLRPDVEVLNLRGNLGTRLEKLKQKHFDAIILAAAGLERLGIKEFQQSILPIDEFIPAIGQGALGIECRLTDSELIEKLSILNDPTTHACVSAERAVNQRLGGNCYVPIAAFAEAKRKQLFLRAMVASVNGQEYFYAEGHASLNHAAELGLEVAEQLLAQGANSILEQFQLEND